MIKKDKILISLIIISIITGSLLIFEIQSKILSLEPDYKEETLDFLKDFLWDQEYNSFYSYRLNNGSFTDKSLQKYTSFNIWAVRTFLQYSISQKDNFTFEEYGIPALNFLILHSQNKSNGGFYHWVNQNGSHLNKDHWLFNNSMLQIGTYQAWMLLTLIEVYNFTQNSSYIDIWGKDTADFLINTLWDSTNGGFYESYLPFYDEIYVTEKFSWYQAYPALALMAYYEITGNETYMNYAKSALDFMISYLWNENLHGFIVECLENGTVDEEILRMTDQAGAILAFSKVAALTGNQSYWDDYVIPILNFTESYMWNDEVGQFYYSYDINTSTFDTINRPSDLSIWLYSLFQVIEYSNLPNKYEYMLTTSLNHMIANAWDSDGLGFFRKFSLNGTILDLDKWTIEQIIPLYLFCNFFPKSRSDYTTFYIELIILGGLVISIVYTHIKMKKS